MSNAATPTDPAGEGLALRDPPFAALLAWLVPGAGHLYQGRTAKGLLFFICIMGGYSYGLYRGERQTVYFQWKPEDRHFPFICQVGVGLPSLPAFVQAYRVRDGKPPLWGGFMAPPFVMPEGGDTNQADELDKINARLHRHYEMGTVYTMIAGLLNLLVIFDAYYGPVAYVEQPVKPSRRKTVSSVQDSATKAGSVAS